MSGSASITNTFAARSAPIPLSQLDKNFTDLQSYANDPTNRANYATDTGTTNTVLLSFTPPVLGYTAGLAVSFKAINANSGSVAINVNALGVKGFLNPDQSALQSGQFIVGGVYNAMYDGTQFILQTGYSVPATKAQMQTATSAITFVSPAQAKNAPSAAKAWGNINFNLTGTLTLSTAYNIASIVNTGNALSATYTISFTTPFAGGQYASIFQNGNPADVRFDVVSISSAGLTIASRTVATGAATIAGTVSFVFYGNQ